MAGALLSGCTAEDTPPTPAPLPPEQAAAPEDVCRELLPPRALDVLRTVEGFTAFTFVTSTSPLNPPGGTGSFATEACELRLDQQPQAGVVVRRVLDAQGIQQLRDGIRKTTDELEEGPAGWDVRWSDAASTAFVFSTGDTVQEAYILQQVGRPGPERREIALRLADAVLGDVARPQ